MQAKLQTISFGSELKLSATAFHGHLQLDSCIVQCAHAAGATKPPVMQVSLDLWPNKDFADKRGKFGLEVLPLEALLDYNEDDTKESHFELSVFAEIFKEMLQTRFARGLIRGLAVIEHEVSHLA